MKMDPSRSKSGVNSKIACCEYIRVLASRVYFSAFYRGVYCSMIFCSILVIFWTIANGCKIPNSGLFISLEIMMSALLFFEIAIRLLAQRKQFFTNWCNLIDLFVAVISTASIFLYFHEDAFLEEELEEVATDSILALRNAVQYIRLLIFLRDRKKNAKVVEDDIDFNSILHENVGGRFDDEENEVMLKRTQVIGSLNSEEDHEWPLEEIVLSPTKDIKMAFPV